MRRKQTKNKTKGGGQGGVGNWISINPVGVNPYVEVPRVPACYVVYLEGVLTYVGQTVNLNHRLQEHIECARYSQMLLTPWGDCINVLVKYRPSRRFGDWAMHELRLIKRLQPIGNIRGIRKRKKVNAES